MVAGNPRSIRRGPGRLIVEPTTSFASTSFPYGGTQVGHVRSCLLRSDGESRIIFNKLLGEPTDVLDGPNLWVMTCMVRSWDDDAVEHFLAGGHNPGIQTQHTYYDVPGSRKPGQSSVDALGLVIAMVPDDTINAQGFVIYCGIPMWDDAAELAWQTRAEFGIPLKVQCLRSDYDSILQVGRMPDLSLR